jgi:hypothetical protein
MELKFKMASMDGIHGWHAVCRLPLFHGCPNENFVHPIFERCFQVRDFFFWITEAIGLTGVSLHF